MDVYNTQGEKIMETLISNSQTQINIGNQIGVYYYALKKDGELKSSGKLVIQ